MVLTPAQCKGARAMLDLSRDGLAAASGLTARTVTDFERGARTPHANNLQAIRSALEAAGVEFIPENGGGAGVRLRQRPAGS